MGDEGTTIAENPEAVEAKTFSESPYLLQRRCLSVIRLPQRHPVLCASIVSFPRSTPSLMLQAFYTWTKEPTVSVTKRGRESFFAAAALRCSATADLVLRLLSCSASLTAETVHKDSAIQPLDHLLHSFLSLVSSDTSTLVSKSPSPIFPSRGSTCTPSCRQGQQVGVLE